MIIIQIFLEFSPPWFVSHEPGQTEKTYHETTAYLSSKSNEINQQYQAGLDNVYELLQKWKKFFK